MSDQVVLGCTAEASSTERHVATQQSPPTVSQTLSVVSQQFEYVAPIRAEEDEAVPVRAPIVTDNLTHTDSWCCLLSDRVNADNIVPTSSAGDDVGA